MNNQKSNNLKIFICLLIVTFSLIGIVLNFLFSKNLSASINFNLYAIIFLWFCIVTTTISIYEIFEKFINTNDTQKSLEDNIKDFYQSKNLDNKSDVEMYN